MVYSIWAHALLLEQPNSACCFTGEHEWNKIYDSHTGAKRIFAKICINDSTLICPLGEPIRNALVDINSLEHPPIFIPAWAVRSLKVEGVGDTATVEWCSEEYFPDATKIILRPHDHTFYESDVKKELEEALTQYGVLQVGLTIPIKIQALNNREIQFDVIALEPASTVLMQGDEVEIEFEKSFNEPERPATVAAPVEVGDLPMIPEPIRSPIVVDGGHLLGGEPIRRLPDGRRWYHWMNTRV